MEWLETKIVFKERTKRKNKDRRCRPERRKSYSRKYFDDGGKERRSGRERRFVWDMTM